MGRRKEEGPNKTEREGGGRKENGGITDKTVWRRDKKKTSLLLLKLSLHDKKQVYYNC